MQRRGKTIELYLIDGMVTGRWKANLSNWNGILFRLPRTSLQDCLRECEENEDLMLLQTPGVYFLFGRDDTSDQPFIYVGESENVLRRLLQPHTFESGKHGSSFWSEAVVLVTPDSTLEKGRIKYLESRFHAIAVDSGRYLVRNANNPTRSRLPRWVQDTLEDMIQNVQMVLPALGHKVLEPSPSQDSTVHNDDLLFFQRRSSYGFCRAQGRVAEDGFWVLKGSILTTPPPEKMAKGVLIRREQYADRIQEGTLLQDILFGSPSAAGSFVCGLPCNGPSVWKNSAGLTLKQLTGDSSASESAAGDEEPAIQDEPEQIAIPEPAPPEDPDLFFLNLNTHWGPCSARGRRDNDIFWLLKDSTLAPVPAGQMPPNVQKKRTTAKIQDNLLQQDIPFADPGLAGVFVCGPAFPGLSAWKTASGLPLEEETAPSPSNPDPQENEEAPAQNSEPEPPPEEPSEPEPPAPPVPSIRETLYLRHRKANATGLFTENGFLVLKGAQIRADETESCQPAIHNRRAQLLADGLISEDSILLQDVLFPSPATAASVIIGSSAYSNMLWRTRSGVPLGTLREGGCQTPSDPEGGEEENLLFLSTKHAQGTGMLTEQGFLLQKGSRLRPEELKSCANNVRSLRAQLRADGSVSEDNVLTRDVLFSSPSFAAGFLNGSSADGNSMWHTRNGTVLGALRESPVSDNPEAEPEPADPQTSPEEPQLPPEHLKLHLSSRTLSAFGYQTEEGFIVLQGSTVHPTESPGCPDSVRKLRASMVQDGTIQNCVLTKDVTFSSPSTAATVLRGSRCSGLTVWLDDNGVPLGTLIKNTPGSDT